MEIDLNDEHMTIKMDLSYSQTMKSFPIIKEELRQTIKARLSVLYNALSLAIQRRR